MKFNFSKSGWVQHQSLRSQGIIAFSPRYIIEADGFGIKFGTAEFLLYQHLRWWEENSDERIFTKDIEYLRDFFGFDSERGVRDALNSLINKDAIVHTKLQKDDGTFTKNLWMTTTKYAEICPDAVKKNTEIYTGFEEVSTNSPLEPPLCKELIRKNNIIPKSTPVPPLKNPTSFNNSALNATLPASPEAPPASRTETNPVLYLSRASTTKGIEPSLQVSTPASSTSPVSNQQEEGVPTPVKPFSSAVSSSSTSVDLKAKKNATNRRVALLAQRLLRETGAKAKRPGGQLINLIKSALSKGYSELDLITACKRGKEHDWYSSHGIFAMLSEKGLSFLTDNEAWKKYEEEKAFGERPIWLR